MWPRNERGFSAHHDESCGACGSRACDVVEPMARERPTPQKWRRAQKLKTESCERQGDLSVGLAGDSGNDRAGRLLDEQAINNPRQHLAAGGPAFPDKIRAISLQGWRVRQDWLPNP